MGLPQRQSKDGCKQLLGGSDLFSQISGDLQEVKDLKQLEGYSTGL